MSVRILIGDCREVLRTLPDESVNCIVTSPPYFGLRDYGHAGQIGLEQTPAEYVAEMVAVFRDARRVLRDDGTFWLNLGDSYAGHNPTGFRPGNEVKNGGASNKNGVGFIAGLKAKDLIGIPWRVAFALQSDGWYLRQDIIWSKPNPMPESVKDRCTKSHEYVFLFAKSSTYHYDADAVSEPFSDDRMGNPGAYKRTSAKAKGACNDRQDLGFLNNGDGWNADGSANARNKRSVWTIATQPYSEAHFATMAPELAETCIKAGCPVGGTVLDPFGGAGTTGLVADRLGRNAILIELNPEYAAMARKRLTDDAGMFAEVA